jgi:cell division septal protein FtsQ
MTEKKKGTRPIETGPVPFSVAEGETPADVSRLVVEMPALMREALRRADEPRAAPTLAQLAASAIPRLAAATTLAVIGAVSYIAWVRSQTTPPPTTAKAFESVVIDGGGPRSDDPVFDALLVAGRSDG